MRRVQRLVASIGIALGVAGISAQAKPDFSGRWTVVTPADSAGQVQHVKQDAKTLTTSHASEGHGHHAVYNLDGTESRIVTPSHGSEIVGVAKATWSGSQLIITEVVTYPDKRRVDGKQVWSLDQGGRLVIEVTHTPVGEAPVTITLVYTK